jgi:Asp-tRNA(Asn)/Glu-tRNA(Gln) amidotransferase A subunit family amidase
MICQGAAGVWAALFLLMAAPLAIARSDFRLLEASIDDIQAAYKSGELTARELVQMYLDRIAAYNNQGPKINAIITLNPHALEEADRLDAEYRRSGFVGPLHGIPVLVKDQIDVAGLPTTLGSLVFKDYRPTRDAFVIAQLRRAGAIVLGKTALGEFGGGDTYGSIFGATRNPYDLRRTPGGSSGGSAAGLAANFAVVGLGEEDYASIRRPAAWCAIVSLRPTPGLVSRSGMWFGYPSPRGQMGPMGRSVRDVAHLLDSMVGYDPEDPVTALGYGKVKGSYTQRLRADALRGARIGVLREPIGEFSEPASEDFRKVDLVFSHGIEELKAAGASVIDPIVIPGLKALLSTYYDDPSAFDAALRRYLARNPSSPIKTREDIRRSPELAKSITPDKIEDWSHPFRPADMTKLAAFEQARQQLMVNLMNVMAANKLDAIVLKSVEHQPNLIEESIKPPYKPTRGMVILNTFLIYTAAITVPAGFTSDDLPVGITFLGGPYTEPTLLPLAYAYEQSSHHRRGPESTPALARQRQ